MPVCLGTHALLEIHTPDVPEPAANFVSNPSTEKCTKVLLWLSLSGCSARAAQLLEQALRKVQVMCCYWFILIGIESPCMHVLTFRL